MGPFMPGLRPGMSGYGGPIGPNVNPSLRRPGFFPPGVNATTGSYGLPAAANYNNLPQQVVGNHAPRPRPMTPDTGIGNTTSESTTETTPSVTTAELVTPVEPHAHLAPHVTPATAPSVADSVSMLKCPSL
jgi:hypothetical protein